MTRSRRMIVEDRALCLRIVGEYLEMPGLKLTFPQACRLWGVDHVRCEDALAMLLASGFLRRTGDSYVRAQAGRHAA